MRVTRALHAFNTITKDRALTRAAALDRSARGRARAPARRADCAEGQPLHARHPDDGVVSNPRALCAALRRDRRRAPRARRRGDRGQDQLRRVRDGIVERELGVRTGAEPVGQRSHAGRLERGIRGGGRRRSGAGRARLRHRRLDPSAGGAVRHRRAEADVRSRLALRPDCICVLARPDRPADTDRGGCGHAPWRAGGARSSRRDSRAAGRSRLRSGAHRGRVWRCESACRGRCSEKASTRKC